MSFWRKIIGLDPVPVRNHGVVSLEQLYGGQLHVDPAQLVCHSANAGGRWLERQLAKYPPSNPRGNPLADKESKRPLHLDDYQPRTSEYPAMRVFRERSFPEHPPLAYEEIHRRGRWEHQQARDWVHYRNRHPGMRDFARGELPPMRDAMQDLLTFLTEFGNDLIERGLVAVEVGVQHEPAEQVPGEPQGWHFRVEALTVPAAALAAEQQWHEEYRAAAEKALAEAEERLNKR